MELKTLIDFLDSLLSVQDVVDFCPNGLQVEGRSSIQKIVTGVSANQALFTKAVDAKADAILVHHGLFWYKADYRPIQLMRKRLDILFRHNISLLAYHLPLDFHLKYGNNIQFAKKLDFVFEEIYRDKLIDIPVFMGKVKSSVTGEALADRLKMRLNRVPFYIPGRTPSIEKVAWCVGGAPTGLYTAAEQGADAYITGEISEPIFSTARELGIHFYAAGHHASEMFGIQALGQYAAQKFELDHQFINIDNPV
jgi:dinuclear metal center YbgI/SA1388 family protein